MKYFTLGLSLAFLVSGTYFSIIGNTNLEIAHFSFAIFNYITFINYKNKIK